MDLELYATNRTAVAVQGTVKRQILHLLTEGRRGFDEFVRATGRVKSTISRHLKELEAEGLISSYPDKLDKRKRLYIIEARLIGMSTEKESRLDRKTTKNIAASLDDPGRFINAVLRSIRYRFDSLGIDVAPMLYGLGKEIGAVIAKGMTSTDMDGVLIEVTAFWEGHGLGNLEVLDKNPLTIVITNCYECSDMPNVGKTLCAFDEGILEGIFSSRLKQAFKVKEVECAGTGYNHCKYIFVPL